MFFIQLRWLICVDFFPNRNVYFIFFVNFGALWYVLVKWTYILESMARHDIAEILLTLALNTNQSINQLESMIPICPSIRQTVSSTGRKCPSPLKLWIRTPFMARCTRYNIVIKFVSDLRQVGGFLRIPPPIKLTVTI
jgi:hypothetical protein